MTGHFILTDYVAAAIARAEYDKFEDGTYAGRIPECAGVLAFGPTLNACQDELRSTLEDWILLGLKLSHDLPIIDGIDLNQAQPHEMEKAADYYSSLSNEEVQEQRAWGEFSTSEFARLDP